jgi:hypothetical protein
LFLANFRFYNELVWIHLLCKCDSRMQFVEHLSLLARTYFLFADWCLPQFIYYKCLVCFIWECYLAFFFPLSNDSFSCKHTDLPVRLYGDSDGFVLIYRQWLGQFTMFKSQACLVGNSVRTQRYIFSTPIYYVSKYDCSKK